MASENQIPASIFISEDPTEQMILLDAEELLFVLSGECEVREGGASWRLLPGDVVLTGRGELRGLRPGGVYVRCVLDSVSLVPELRAGGTLFTVNSVKYPHPTKYERLKYLLARLIRVQSLDDCNCASMSAVYDILSELLLHFRFTGRGKEPAVSKNSRRKNEILSYISEHYRESLTLQSVAKEQYLSVPYLSSFFSKNVGVTFTVYYDNLRLERAVRDLLCTDKTIEAVARDNGFSDSRSFLRLFKQRYRMLPSVFRQEHDVAATETGVLFRPGNSLFYPSVGASVYLPLLSPFLEPAARHQSMALPNALVTRCGAVRFSDAGTPLRHTFRDMCAVSSAKALLYSEVQDTLRLVQREIGFSYISFYGLLNIDNYLYSEQADGTPRYTFTLVDKILDFLQSIRLKPVLNLSYMPYQLGAAPRMRALNYLMETQPPKDFEKWKALIEALTRHLIHRYGEAEVSSWRFNVWKKPEIFHFSIGEEAFFQLYRATWEAVKGVSPRISFGTPPLACNSPATVAWDVRFLAFCRKSRCMPDFLCFSYYNDTFDNSETDPPLYLLDRSYLRTDPDAYAVFLDGIEAFRKEQGVEALPAYMTQWNLTVSQRNLINDTCFSSAYIVKNLLENYDRMESFCYWNLSDYSEETELPARMFFGGIGMFTHNGVKKPSFFAFKYVSRLLDRCIGRGEGWFVTKSAEDRKIVAIFYNYEHYSREFAEGRAPELQDMNRYAPFTERKKRRFVLKLEELDARRCSIREFYTNHLHGSAYDEWAHMGGAPLRERELEILRMIQSGLFIHTEKVNNGILMLETELEPLEIRLVEIELLD